MKNSILCLKWLFVLCAELSITTPSFAQQLLSGVGGGISQPPSGGYVYAPVPEKAPSQVNVTMATSNSLTLSWQESGTNTYTTLYRQVYDLDGNPSGSPKVIATFQSLPTGTMTYTDSGVQRMRPLPPTGLTPDREYGYYVVEQFGNTCEVTHGGYTCAQSPWAFGFTKSAYLFPAKLIQLRLQLSTASYAGAPNEHVVVSLGHGNNTWLNSTKADFTVGSNIKYNLDTHNISQQSDIQYLTISTPDNNAFCVNAYELLVDNRTIYSHSFGSNGVTCQKVSSSAPIEVSFAQLRSSADWQNFLPPDINPQNVGQLERLGILPPHTPIYFGGYRAKELISLLDGTVGSQLRNPANNRGDNAGLQGIPTTTKRIDATHLAVQQYITGIDAGWGLSVSASPTYNLVIHNKDALCCTAGDQMCAATPPSCIKIENVSPNASVDGLLTDIPWLPSLVIEIIGSVLADNHLSDSFSSMSQVLSNAPTLGGFSTGYCFPTEDSSALSILAKSLGQTNNEGFGVGSLTVCIQ
ncbi:hypothetical protein [Methylomonas sp. AM2-LC]|uniref:hypothetical protein n=1 Tax=Methylomonas sp. AM2-LC TaxID=3153301 RepID=UPI003263C2ED